MILSQCFDVPCNQILSMDISDGSEWVIEPSLVEGSYWTGWALIPQPHENCPLLNPTDYSIRLTYYREMSYKAGYLIDGVYYVNYQDTLSSIGRTYGYLPSMIAAENGLIDLDTIAYMQALKMPTYPSLYTLASVVGAGGVIVLMSTGIYGLRRWIHARTHARGKKKNA